VPFVYFVPIDTDPSRLYSDVVKDTRFRKYSYYYSLGEKIKELDNGTLEGGKILYSSSMHYVHLNYFVEDNIERILYFDHLNPDAFVDENAANFIKDNHINYGVYFKTADNTGLECVQKYQDSARRVFEKYGDLVYSTDAVDLYVLK
jgi:hypothetical protein